MYPWLKMLLHCKNKITYIFPYFFKENTVKYSNTFQKKRRENWKSWEFFFPHALYTTSLMKCWEATEVEAPKPEHTLCLKISWESQAPRAFFQPGAGFKVSWYIYNICAAAAIFALPPRRSAAISTTTTSSNKNEAQWSEKTRQKNCMSDTVQSFSDVGFCCIVGLSGLQIDWPMSLGFKYIFPFLNVIYYLQVFHFKNGGKNNIITLRHNNFVWY